MAILSGYEKLIAYFLNILRTTGWKRNSTKKIGKITRSSRNLQFMN